MTHQIRRYQLSNHKCMDIKIRKSTPFPYQVKRKNKDRNPAKKLSNNKNKLEELDVV